EPRTKSRRQRAVRSVEGVVRFGHSAHRHGHSYNGLDLAGNHLIPCNDWLVSKLARRGIEIDGLSWHVKFLFEPGGAVEENGGLVEECLLILRGRLSPDLF